jgi:hypothetical protein
MPVRLAVLVVGLAVTRLAAGPAAEVELLEYAVAPDSSVLYVLTRKSGLLSFLGHEHAIVPDEWSASFCLADPIPQGARGRVVIRTASLVIDSEGGRALAGLGRGPGEQDRQEIQRKMLDPDHLAAESYPEIRLDVVALEEEAGGQVGARANVTVRDVTRSVELPVQVEREGSALRLAGVAVLRQSDFGIEPDVVARVVKVSDPVELHFTLVATPTGRACAR